MSAQLRQRCAEMTRQLQRQHSMRGIKYLFLIMKRSCVLELEPVDELFKSLNRVMGLKQPQSVAR